MATVKKLIGRLPVYKGDWVAGTYSMLNQVSYLGSTFQSKIDNNTSQPATLVNNVLQVNSNWSVISNGTAAYVANDRLTACETASTYAQAGVDTLRSDVQGCICTYDDRNNYFIKDSSQFSIAFYVTGKLIASESDIVVCGYPGLDSILYFGYGTGGIRYRQFTPNIMAVDNTRTDGYFVVTFDSGTIKIYCNGVLVSTTTGFEPKQSIRRYIKGWDNRGVSLSRLQFFNYTLTQQQIDSLYNQGRCDEVVFGDAYKKQYYEFNPIFRNVENSAGSEGTAVAITNGFKYSFIKKGTSSQYPRIVHKTLTNYVPIGSYINIEFDYNVIYGNPILSTIETIGLNPTQDYDKFGQQLTGSGKIKLRSKSISKTQGNELRLCFGTPDQPFEIDVTNVKIYFDSVVNEYIPQYLTKTKWIDSGVNKQDIALTSPTFSYVKPYKDFEFAEGAPTTPPVASGCMRIDRTNKRAYLSILK